MTDFTATKRNQGDSNVTARAKTPSRRTGFAASLGGLLGAGGSGAPSRRRASVAALMVAALVVLAFAASASARQTRLYTGTSFGPEGTTGVATFEDIRSIAVDQPDGNVYVLDNGGGGTLYKFDAAGNPVPFGATGTNAIEGVGSAFNGGENQIAVAPASAPAATGGDIYVVHRPGPVQVYSPAGVEIGTLGEGTACGVAVNPAGHLFIASTPKTVREYVPKTNPPTNADLTATGTAAIGFCQIAVDGIGNVYASANSAFLEHETAKLEGIADPEPTLIRPGGLTLATDPVGNELYLDEADHVSVYDSAAAHAYDFGAGQLSDSLGIAVSPFSNRIYVGDAATSTVKVFGPFVEVPVVTTEEASGVQFEAATLNGTVEPEGLQLEECVFEYWPATDPGLKEEAHCTPPAANIPPDSSPHEVTGTLTELQPNTTYRFRLTATVAGLKTSGEELEFLTSGPPRITEIASSAYGGSAMVGATVDPRGDETSYRIEWGPANSYGNVAATGTIAAAEGPTRISAHLAGLAPATQYHWRVVAASTDGGETVSPDQMVETLNSCGLTDGRCYELVSRADKGPLASPGKLLLSGQAIQFQAAAAGSAFAYTVPYGYPEATAGDAAEYLGRRGIDGWTSQPISPPRSESSTGPAEGLVGKSHFNVLSTDLGCGVVSSAAAAPGAASTVVELFGGANLYRRDDTTGSYRLITYLPPVGHPSPGAHSAFTTGEYQVIGMSPDCERVVFRTSYRYPGIPAVSGAKFQLYEWDDGTLRNVAMIPGPGGIGEPVPAESLPGSLSAGSGAVGKAFTTNYWRAVSTGGSRSAFTAVSRFGGDAGRLAVFLSDAGDPAVLAGTAPATDISKSETAVPNDGDSLYWIASADGTRVFFTARYGLAANGASSGANSCDNAPFVASGEGCDLYEYDAAAPAGERLTDLSPDTTDPKGAGVVGVLDASDDGSYVYFAARGRLGAGGRNEAANLRAGTYNVYLAHGGEMRFVGSLGQAEALGGHALVGTGGPEVEETQWTSRSSGDGASFVFESSLGVPGDVPMVYLYSVAAGTTTCVSCRHDGQAPFSEQRFLASLLTSTETNTENRNVQPTVLTDNGRLYFYSFDPLAPGGVEGARNLYQWERGQVSLIASEPLGVPRTEGTPTSAFFGGTSADGGDVYFATPQRLVGAAPEGWNVYDARVGGGFPEPAPPAPPCDAGVEGACNQAGGGPPVAATPPTSTFTGPGNPPAKKHKKKHHKKHHGHHRKKHGKKHHGKKHHGMKHHKKAGKGRRANSDRRAGK